MRISEGSSPDGFHRLAPLFTSQLPNAATSRLRVTPRLHFLTSAIALRVKKFGPPLWVLALSALVSTNARAFENQWHLGASANALTFAGDKSYWVPTLGLYGAYGLSDVFDVRLETGLGLPVSPTKSGASLEYGELVLAYKVDIIEWIPWVGLGAGVFGATGDLQGGDRNALQPAGSLWIGMDYAFSREWGVGALFAMHSWFADSTRSNVRLAAEQFGLRFEHRFGW
jgi:hypothetical protein